MAKLEDYGIRIINHGSWSDPEVRWEKSSHQTLLFNYWDCVDCFEDENYDFDNEEDLELFAQNLWNLTPIEYEYPDIFYEWIFTSAKKYWSYDEADYNEEYNNSKKEDFVPHTTSQALNQALTFLDNEGIRSGEIEIYYRTPLGRTLVAKYSLQGSTLKDCMDYAN